MDSFFKTNFVILGKSDFFYSFIYLRMWILRSNWRCFSLSNFRTIYVLNFFTFFIFFKLCIKTKQFWSLCIVASNESENRKNTTIFCYCHLCQKQQKTKRQVRDNTKKLVKTKKNNKNLFFALSEVFLEVFLFAVCHKKCGWEHLIHECGYIHFLYFFFIRVFYAFWFRRKKYSQSYWTETVFSNSIKTRSLRG